MACTATLRKPFTSPFSLTMATRCTRGTGYSRLLRYTKALQTGTEKERGSRNRHREIISERHRILRWSLVGQVY